jgi:hypothetical protein
VSAGPDGTTLRCYDRLQSTFTACCVQMLCSTAAATPGVASHLLLVLWVTTV